MNRFAHEIAEKRLDDFVSGLAPESPGLERAYVRFKLTLTHCALVDYWEEGDERATARAWEEADVAFRGYSDEIVTGAVMALWARIPKGREEDFRSAIDEAFTQAFAATPRRIRRLHLAKYRKAPIRDLASGFNLPVAIPIHGPRFRSWMAESFPGLPYSMEYLEKKLRDWVKRKPPVSEPPPPPPASHLRLL